MNKRCKAILIFSFVFWGLVVVGFLLTGFSFGRIPVGFYGLREFYWETTIDDGAYTSGVYPRGLTTQFVRFPATMQYIVYSQSSANGVLKLVSSDSQPFTLEYTAAYRIVKSSLKNTYKNYADKYQQLLKSAINNKILQITAVTTSNNLWKSATQDKIKDALITLFTDPNSRYGCQLHAFWLGDIRFGNLQDYYSNSYIDSSSTNAAYSKSLYNLMNMNIQISMVNASINQFINQNLFLLNQTYQNSYLTSMKLNTAVNNYFTSLDANLSTYAKYFAFRNFTKIEFV